MFTCIYVCLDMHVFMGKCVSVFVCECVCI